MRKPTAKDVGHGTIQIPVRYGINPLNGGQSAPKYRIPEDLRNMPINRAMEIMEERGLEQYRVKE